MIQLPDGGTMSFEDYLLEQISAGCKPGCTSAKRQCMESCTGIPQFAFKCGEICESDEARCIHKCQEILGEVDAGTD